MLYYLLDSIFSPKYDQKLWGGLSEKKENNRDKGQKISSLPKPETTLLRMRGALEWKT